MQNSSFHVISLRLAARLSIRTAAKLYGTKLKTWKEWEAGETEVPDTVIDFLRAEAGGLQMLELSFEDPLA